MTSIKNATIYYILITVATPLIGFLINLLFCKNNPKIGSRIAATSIWIGCGGSLLGWLLGLPLLEKNELSGFIANEISWLMATLILFVSSIVHHFSIDYMAGDRNYRRYFLFLSMITVSTLLMVASDNILSLIFCWSLSNLILIFLMIHKFEWTAAKNSGLLALKTFLLGLLFLGAASGLLVYHLETTSLHLISINSANLPESIRITTLLLITLAAFTQSGIWPFHSWLISSLNSPTPVSALMHAGLVNGGGLLIARFANVYFHESLVLNFVFVLAVISLILGGIWKLLQSDIKRMLACSTMTQMGFMMMQCGLGLIPAALAHLFWHGLFKAFLFLRSGSTISEGRKNDENRESTTPLFFLSSLCGMIGALGFSFGSALSISFVDTSTVLIFFSWMASTQIAHTTLEKNPSAVTAVVATFICFIAGSTYGLTVHFIEIAVSPLQLWQPLPLNSVHLFAIFLMFTVWIALNLKPVAHHESSLWWKWFYVKMLNSSQPNPKTITVNKNEYTF